MTDARLRVAAFEWLEQQRRIFGDTLTRDMLAKGFHLDGQRVPLIGPQGIFKPALAAPGQAGCSAAPGVLGHDVCADRSRRHHDRA